MTERLPITQKLMARPVWRRSLRRALLNTEELGPPTDEERYDAIRVLEDTMNATLPALWLEAQLIFKEASE